jgi:hypothetical protein
MTTYSALASSGVRVDLDARTLTGAKREASAWISFGGGNVTLCADGVPVAMRRFWRNLNHFGWDRWEAL